jgi:cyanophycin synthetase
MIKRYTKNIYFDFYLNAADKLNITYKILSPLKTTARFCKDGKSLFISNAMIGINNELSANFAKNKNRAYELLKKKNIPLPIFQLFREKDCFDFIKENTANIPKPLVVKPTRGCGGTGVSVNVISEKQLRKAIDFAKEKHDKILIEEFIRGDNYRILVFQDKIIDIAKRIPANICGNGKDSIKKLIRKKNKKRKEAGLKPIRFDEEQDRQLESQELKLDSIISKGKTIFVRKSCNMAAGGETKRILAKDVHKKNLDMFLKAVNTLGLEFAGIDFITPDISKSYKDVKCIINEVNRAPSLDVHYFADMKLDNFVAETILNTYFSS